MNVILLEPSEVAGNGRAVLSGVRAAHVRTVLRAQMGQTIRVGLLDGPLGIGTIESFDDGRVEMTCAFDQLPPPRPRVDLLLALPRPKVMRRLWSPLASLGVGRILLTNAERVERNYFDTNVLSGDIYRPLLVDGLQQARDTWLPCVSIHRQFKILIEDQLDDLCPATLRLAADPASPTNIRDPIATHSLGRTLLAIGPEGGWNEFELRLLQRHGFTPVGLGPRTLRSDIACIALLALVHDAIKSLDG